MDQSSSYKHLTVILAALLTTIVIAIIALVLLLSSPSISDDPPDSAIGDSSTRDPSVVSPQHFLGSAYHLHLDDR